MRSMWKDVWVIVVAATPMLLAACSAADAPCGDENCGAIASDLIAPCESFGCGGNASIGDLDLHELHAGGSQNEKGLVLVGFTSGEGAAHRLPVGTPMVLDVQGDRLLGQVAGQPAVEGDELRGAEMRLRRRSGRAVFVQIRAISETEFWVAADAGPARTSVYDFRISFGITLPAMSAAEGQPLCDGSAEDSIPPGEGTIAIDSVGSPNRAIVFTGDRYDSLRGTVEVPGGPGWFNIACVGTALAKMHLLRHTSAGGGSTTSPTVEGRQAMLKLLGADYCGDGRAYARNGNPLFFQDQDGRFDPSPWWGDRVAEFEAIWTAAGALCLDDPRRWEPTQSYAELRAELVTACENSPVESFRRTIPRCSPEQLASWWSLGHISRNVNP